MYGRWGIVRSRGELSALTAEWLYIHRYTAPRNFPREKDDHFGLLIAKNFILFRIIQ